MNLLEVWSNTLSFYKPQNLKLFLLVTLKSIIETYKIMLGTFWPIIVGFFALAIISGAWLIQWIPVFNAQAVPESWSPSLLLLSLLLIVSGLGIAYIVFLIYLIVRPSVYLKDYGYIKRYTRYIFWFWAALIFCSIILNNAGIFQTILRALFGILSYYFAFFYLDTQGGFWSIFSSLKRSIKMVLYTLPIVLSLALFSFLYAYGVEFLLGSSSADVSKMFLEKYYMMALYLVVSVLILTPIEACFMNNLYIKYLHENFELYFEPQGK